MKITLKKGSIGATTPGEVADPSAIPPAEISSSDSVMDPSADSVEGIPVSPLAETLGGGGVSAVRRSKGANVYGIIFAVLGFLAIAVFLTLLILQGSEISFYKAPDSLWLK